MSRRAILKARNLDGYDYLRQTVDNNVKGGYGGGMKKKYWSNVLAMLGVAIIATALFREDWMGGCALGLWLLKLGSIMAKE